MAKALDRIRAWFNQNGWTPFAFQEEVWQAYLDGQSGLIYSPTGTGKTYAAWLGPLIEWMESNPSPSKTDKSALKGSAAPALRVLWITIRHQFLTTRPEMSLAVASNQLRADTIPFPFNLPLGNIAK